MIKNIEDAYKLDKVNTRNFVAYIIEITGLKCVIASSADSRLKLTYETRKDRFAEPDNDVFVLELNDAKHEFQLLVVKDYSDTIDVIFAGQYETRDDFKFENAEQITNSKIIAKLNEWAKRILDARINQLRMFIGDTVQDIKRRKNTLRELESKTFDSQAEKDKCIKRCKKALSEQYSKYSELCKLIFQAHAKNDSI